MCDDRPAAATCALGRSRRRPAGAALDLLRPAGPRRCAPNWAAGPVGLLGFGHIAQAVAERAKAFGMPVHVADRSPVTSPLVDGYVGLEWFASLPMGSADAVVVSLPLAPPHPGPGRPGRAGGHAA